MNAIRRKLLGYRIIRVDQYDDVSYMSQADVALYGGVPSTRTYWRSRSGKIVRESVLGHWSLEELSGNHLERAAIERYLTDVYGKRCEIKDTDDMPEIANDPKATRCLTCQQWERYDQWVAERGSAS